MYEQIAVLEEEEKQNLIDKGEAYYCKKCKKFVKKSTISTEKADLDLCYSCYQKKRLLERKKELMDKLKGARVVDIESSGFDSLKGLALYSNGILFELKVRGDDDEQWIDIVETKKQLVDDEIIRPGSKPRLEKPLERYIVGMIEG